MKIFILKIPNNPAYLNDQTIINVIKEKKAKFYRINSQQDKYHCLFSDILIRYLCTKYLKVPRSNITFKKNEYGKPSLFGTEDFYFNVSHSGEWIVCAIDDKPVGIDIERIVQIDLNIAESFFSLDEQEFINQGCNIDEKRNRFYRVWTLKESYLKAIGVGLSINLNSFSVANKKETLSFFTNEKEITYYFQEFYISNKYKLSTCCMYDSIPKNITYVKLEDLVDYCK